MKLNIRYENIISLKKLEKKRILFHASSVGEINAFYPLIKAALEENLKINISVFTKTGFEQAKKLFKNQKNVSIYSFPLLNTFTWYSPQKAILIYENDFWPQIFLLSRKTKTPIFIFDLRSSTKHIEKYKKYFYFYNFIFKTAKKIFVSNKESLEILKELFPKLKSKFSYHPSLKIFKIFYIEDELIKKFLREKVKKFLYQKVFLFASLHDDEYNILKIILEKYKGKYIFLISPRYPYNTKNILEVLKNYKFNIPDKKKFLEDPFYFLKKYKIIFLPYLGIQKYLYPLADITLVGGSFNKKGGHDILEPSYFQNIVLIGSSFENQIANFAFVKNIYIINSLNDFPENFESLKCSKINTSIINKNFLKETIRSCLN